MEQTAELKAKLPRQRRLLRRCIGSLLLWIPLVLAPIVQLLPLWLSLEVGGFLVLVTLLVWLRLRCLLHQIQKITPQPELELRADVLPLDQTAISILCMMADGKGGKEEDFARRLALDVPVIERALETLCNLGYAEQGADMLNYTWDGTFHATELGVSTVAKYRAKKLFLLPEGY